MRCVTVVSIFVFGSRKESQLPKVTVVFDDELPNLEVFLIGSDVHLCKLLFSLVVLDHTALKFATTEG